MKRFARVNVEQELIGGQAADADGAVQRRRDDPERRGAPDQNEAGDGQLVAGALEHGLRVRRAARGGEVEERPDGDAAVLGGRGHEGAVRREADAGDGLEVAVAEVSQQFSGGNLPYEEVTTDRGNQVSP